MRNRSTITAALALAAATIFTIAACGSSVTGSAQPNQSAAASAVSETSQTSRTSETSERTSEELTIPTDLSQLSAELSALQSGLPSDLSIPSDLGIPSGLSIPSNLGLDSPCLTVALAYASVGLALLPALGGNGTFDATQLQSAITSLAAEVPPELAGDVQALAEVAQEANGKSLVEVSELLDSEKYTTATKHIEDWTTANCGG
jgi:hypothetical protein